jgi:hypothetical protein
MLLLLLLLLLLLDLREELLLLVHLEEALRLSELCCLLLLLLLDRDALSRERLEARGNKALVALLLRHKLLLENLLLEDLELELLRSKQLLVLLEHLGRLSGKLRAKLALAGLRMGRETGEAKGGGDAALGESGERGGHGARDRVVGRPAVGALSLLRGLRGLLEGDGGRDGGRASVGV